MKFKQIIFNLLTFSILTILTQIGGFIWILVIYISLKLNKRKRIVFPIIYLLFNLILIPPMASFFGRERMPLFDNNIKPRNLIYPLFFRNYVNSELKELLLKTSTSLKTKNISIRYLDANFPFYNGFPLLPHLSHNDGKKIDISFQYKTKEGDFTPKKPSISGYGVFVNPDKSRTKNCIDKGYLQYDFTKYFTFGKVNNLTFDPVRTRTVIVEILKYSQTQKIFIEPYLKKQMKLESYDKIRFTGCQAVRHDDHIHLQIN